jgi:hypothetical protein
VVSVPIVGSGEVLASQAAGPMLAAAAAAIAGEAQTAVLGGVAGSVGAVAGGMARRKTSSVSG